MSDRKTPPPQGATPPTMNQSPAESGPRFRPKVDAGPATTGGHGPGRGPMGAGLAGVTKARDAGGTLRRLWRYLAVHRWALVATALAVAISALSASYGTLLLGRAIDQYIGRGDLPGLARMILLMIGLYLLGALATWLQSWIMAQVSQTTVYTLRQDLFHKLQSLSLRFFDQRTHGELMSRLTNDVENISMVLSEGATQLISSALTLVSVAAMMLALNWRLALVTMVIIPVMVLITRWLSQYTRRGFRAQQESLGEINGIIEETITGERVVKAYAREQEAIAAFEETNQKLRQASTFAQSFAGLLGPITNMVNNLGMAVVGAVGSWMAVGGLATVGTIASFVNYSRQFGMPLNQLAGLFNMLQSALAGAERVFDILDEQPEVEDADDARPLARVRGNVVFDDVCFGYEPGVPVLKHVSLHAEPGQTVALVGPTGAGKTTIINLLTRFYDIDSGSICIDGRDIRSLPKGDLRRMLGIVLQDTFLFAGTVMDNIRYGRLDATDDEVLAAAHLANADHFITRLPEGYQTHLSERANNLSQGQRQLLAIARAMLADPKILILDEATSSVDTRTEVHIQEALLKLMEGRTSFVIAHRLSTIRGADIILVINEGELIERGTHEELLAQRGFYHHLYMSQFKGKVPETV